MINRYILYGIVCVLAVFGGVLGYELYQERQKSGVEITVGKDGVSIEKN